MSSPQQPRAYLGDLMALLGAFEGAIDFDRIFTGAGRVPPIGDSGHLGPSLSKSMPPHEPSPAIVAYV